MDNNERIQELYQKKVEAENRGDFKTALSICKDLAENYDHFGSQTDLPRMYRLCDKNEEAVEYLQNWRNEMLLENNEPKYRMVMKILGNSEVVALKKLGRIDDALQVAQIYIAINKETLQNIASHGRGDIHNLDSYDRASVALVLDEVAEIYYEKGDFSKASDYVLESREYCNTCKNRYYIGLLLQKGIGGAPKDAKEAEANFLSAYNTLSEDIESNPDPEDLELLKKTCIALAEVYSQESGMIDRQKAKEYYSRAKKYGFNITDDDINKKVEYDIKQATSFTSFVKNETKKGCYVATCVYGSYDCPQVWTLRRFRDEILSNSILGRLFIFIYYSISPTVVKLFGRQSWFNKLFKTPLDNLVSKLNSKGVEDTPYNDK